jgi:hypothetical protein
MILLTSLTLATLLLTAYGTTISQDDGRTIRGSGNVIEETRIVSGISSVNLATIGLLAIEVGDAESLRIEAEDNLMEYIEAEVNNGRLRIEHQDPTRISLRATKPVKYFLTVTGLDAIMINSSGDIEMGDLEADTLTVEIDSSGDVTLGEVNAAMLVVKIDSSGDVMLGELNADMLEVDIDSSGNLDIAGGQVETQDITIDSSGSYTAQDLESAEAEVRLTSRGSATIWVEDNLKANLSSSGDLRYRGNPMVDATTTSSGDITQIGE